MFTKQFFSIHMEDLISYFGVILMIPLVKRSLKNRIILDPTNNAILFKDP